MLAWQIVGEFGSKNMTQIKSPPRSSEVGHATAKTVTARRQATAGQSNTRATTMGEWAVANETAIEFRANGESLAVMMATPADLEDFAVGFALTEGIAPNPAAVTAINVETVALGIIVSMTITDMGAIPERGLEGRSGCGLCGVRTLTDAMQCSRSVTPRPTPSMQAVQTAVQTIRSHQTLNQITHAVHAAAWCDNAGAIIAIREDVGRHNALDKLIGWMSRHNIDPTRGFCLLTSRLSFELVKKSAAADIGVVVAISAPTALALSMAREAEMTVIAVARDDGHVVFIDNPHDDNSHDFGP